MKTKFFVLFICYSVILVISVSSLFIVKSKVIQKSNELKWLNSQILQEKNNVLILKAELAYLTTPERISQLQIKYLNLQAIDKKQLRVFEEK